MLLNHYKSILSVVFLSLILVSSVLSFSVHAESSKTVCVLFDLSDSTRDTAIRDSYLQDFEKKILTKIESGDAIAADIIAESSAAGSTLPVNQELEGFLYSNRLKELKLKKEILGKVKELLRRPQKVQRTDILSSLHIAERVFKTYNKERNILVIMSDMIEDSKSYNFEKEHLTEKKIAEIIAKEKKAKKLPNLTKVDVYAIRNATNLSPEMAAGIENFWMQYFKECGARIDNAHYGPLTKFE
jgi:hypothetical protein